MEVIKKEKQVKEVEVTIEHYDECDRCRKKIKLDSMYSAFKCTFEHKTGDRYPEGGSGDLESVDLCQSCAPIVIKLLEDNGIRINRSEWDW